MRFPIHVLACALLPAIAFAQQARLLDGSLEWMHSEDIGIQSGWIGFQAAISGNTALSGRLDATRHELDYRPNLPIDPLGNPETVEERLIGTQLDWEYTQGRNRLTASGTLYSGFRNPNSIWIDRYYRQQYGQGGLPGVTYETPDPRGFGITGSYRREVIPAAGFLTLSIGYLEDEVAPGYEIEDLGTAFELVKSEERLHTWTGAIDWEGVISGRARTRHSIRLTDTTAREPRASWNGGLNFLISDAWISRAEASFAIENPDFEAGSLAQTLEWSFRPAWSLALTLRYYEDTGQIEAANLISSAAPELSTQQVFLTLRYAAADQVSGFSFSIGPYVTDYGPTGIGTERFRYLYQDRNWIWARFSGRLAF